MSYYLFGEFWTDDCSIHMIQQAKKVLYEKNILLFINEETSYNEDILLMIKEQKIDEKSHNSSIKFGLNTVNPPTHSHNLLTIDELYTREELLYNIDSEKNKRKYLTRQNLDVLKSGLKEMIGILKITNMRIFIASEYDIAFESFKFTIDEMINHIWWQIAYKYEISSIIYHIKMPKK